MASTITIPVSERERERLSRLALRFGLSLPQFSRRVLGELASEIPEESFDDYEHSKGLRASFSRALRQYRDGRVTTHL